MNKCPEIEVDGPSTFSIDQTRRLIDYSKKALPFGLYGWTSHQSLRLPEDLSAKNEIHSFWGYVYAGVATLETPHNTYKLKARQYFCACDAVVISGGQGFLVDSIGYKGLNHIGGPIESSGRLKYLNNSTDTLLISPVRKGEPCLNVLYFPPNTDQLLHYHPSARIGMLAWGCGTYLNSVGAYSLAEGQMFFTRPNECHKFQTGPDQPMTLVIYHPDSLVGPTDEHHAMLDGTIVVNGD